MLMRKTFYSHLIEIHQVRIELEDMNMSDLEKAHLEKIFDSSVHTSVIDHILLVLPEEDQDRFLKRAHDEDHDGIWEILQNISNIEEIIRTAAHAVRNEFTRDIREQKKKK